MHSFRHAVFHASAAKIGDLPPPDRPEVAFAGRSNAGKSSVINALAQRTRLAFVSRTPGRTQMINFFKLTEAGYLVDLPGYGYAEVPRAVVDHWQSLLEYYLLQRTTLVGLVLIMDARLPLTKLDRRMMEWFAPTSRPIHVLLTKSDKLRRGEATRTLEQVHRQLEREHLASDVSVQLFSSLSRQGVGEAEARIRTWFARSPLPSGKEKPPTKGEKVGG